MGKNKASKKIISFLYVDPYRIDTLLLFKK